MEEGEHFKFVQNLMKHAHFESGTITTIDGLRVDFNDGFGLVRASNTTPSLVIRFEAKDQTALIRIQDLFRKFMLDVNPNLELPF